MSSILCTILLQQNKISKKMLNIALHRNLKEFVQLNLYAYIFHTIYIHYQQVIFNLHPMLHKYPCLSLFHFHLELLKTNLLFRPLYPLQLAALEIQIFFWQLQFLLVSLIAKVEHVLLYTSFLRGTTLCLSCSVQMTIIQFCCSRQFAQNI